MVGVFWFQPCRFWFDASDIVRPVTTDYTDMTSCRFGNILVFDYVVMQFGDSEMYLTVSLLGRPRHTWVPWYYRARLGNRNMTRNPQKNFYVLVCWTWTEEIGMVQRFDGIIYCPFCTYRRRCFDCESHSSRRVSSFLAQGIIVSRLLFGLPIFFGHCWYV